MRAATVKPSDLRHLTLEPLAIHASRPDWTMGLLATLAFCLTLGLVQSWDDARAIEDARIAAQALAERERAARLLIDLAPQVRLEGAGLHCRNFRIREEWILAIAAECERLGAMLRVARAAP